MRIVGEILTALFLVACLIGALLSQSIHEVLLGCTGIIAFSIALATSEICAHLRFPLDKEEREQQKKLQKAKREYYAREERKQHEERAEKEMIAEIKLDQIMNPALPEPPPAKRPAAKATDFESIIDGEIKGQPPRWRER